MKFFIEHLLAMTLYYSGLINILRHLGRAYSKIIVYHSISPTQTSFVKGTSEIWTSSRRFTKHLTYITKHYKIISLQNLVEHLKKGSVPRRTAVITFDDGFADNYHFAYPILKKIHIQPTIFLTTQAVDNANPIWLQKLYYLINNFGIEKIVDTFKTFVDWPQVQTTAKNKKEREILHRNFEQFLCYKIAKKVRENIIIKLYDKFNTSIEDVFSENKVFLTWKQIIKMHENGICFGNHAESHTPFSAMSIDDQVLEIGRSKKYIENKIKQSFFPFAYPFGQKNDFTANTTRIIHDAGHSCILSSMPTLNDSNISPQQLGRIVIGNSPVYLLAYKLEKSVLKRLLTSKLRIKKYFKPLPSRQDV